MKKSYTIPQYLKSRKAIVLIADGQTEQWYLSQMLKEENYHVKIKPELPKKKSLDEEFDKVIDCIEEEFDHVFWLIDLDVVNNNKNKDSDWKMLGGIIDKINKKYSEKVIVILNNPCLEFWYLLHYKRTSKVYESYNDLKKDLLHYLPEYEKTEKYYERANGIYRQLKDKLPTATQNAKQLTYPQKPYNKDSFKKALCGMYKIVDYFNSLG